MLLNAAEAVSSIAAGARVHTARSCATGSRCSVALPAVTRQRIHARRWPGPLPLLGFRPSRTCPVEHGCHPSKAHSRWSHGMQAEASPAESDGLYHPAHHPHQHQPPTHQPSIHPLTLSSVGSVDLDNMRSSYESDTEGSGEWPSTSAGSHGYGHIKATYEVLRLDKSGRARQVYARRRDLCKEHRLQPRDLRRIDPSVDVHKTPPSITIKDNVILLCLGGVRAIVTGEKVLLFEPQQPASRKFLEVVLQHFQARQQAGQPGQLDPSKSANGEQQSHEQYMSRFYATHKGDQLLSPPFELEVIESALIVATGNLENDMHTVTQRVQLLLSKLPRDINPVNLEELRRVKGALVELEQKADVLRNMLEELLDDEDELRELNLTNRPRREERRRQRERERLERELERARELKEEIEERLEDEGPSSSSDGLAGSVSGSSSAARGRSPSADLQWAGGADLNGVPQHAFWSGSGAGARGTGQEASGSDHTGFGVGSDAGLPHGEGQPGQSDDARQHDLPAAGMAEHWHAAHPESLTPSMADHASPPAGIAATAAAMAALGQKQHQARMQELRSKFDRARLAELRSRFNWGDSEREVRRRPAGGDDSDVGREGWISRLEGSEEDIQEAQEALEEMVEQEEEEQEIEEIEDLTEFYLQKAATIQDEAERLLAGARDLEESIGISLSARRYEVNRLELTLSIGSFAAAIGALVAGIFGMNMRSMLEMSVAWFWGVTASIVFGCCCIFVAILQYTRQKRIL